MVICISLPRSNGNDAEGSLGADLSAPVILNIPESWCFRISRPPPPGGWSAALRKRLRPGLFPGMAEGTLIWDEEVDGAGTWRVWAVSMERVNAALGALQPQIFSGKRKVRVRPAGHGEEGIAAFPNLARSEWRAFRWPWRRIRRACLLGGPLLALILLGMGLSIHVRYSQQDLDRRLKAAESAYSEEEARSRSEKQVMEALGNVKGGKGQVPPWLLDLDALTRLLPEDTRLVRIRWSSSVIELDVITPHPQAIQEILEASKDFKQVRFVGRMDRQGALSRLTLECSRGEKL